MKSVSGDVIISESGSALALHCQINTSVHLMQNANAVCICDYCALTDGSSGSLDLWSDSGNIDVYVGQGGSAKVFSQSGEPW